MREIAVVSGKGGTGKTIVAGALAVLAGRAADGGAVSADCDVDAANLALILRPSLREEHVFTGPRRAVIDPGLCTGCGACAAACRSGALADPAGGGATTASESDAVRPPVVDALSCEGCGICSHVCPAGAVRMEEIPGGKWFISDTPHGPLVHARLEPGGENSGKLVTIVRNKAREEAAAQGRRLILIDGPPGIGCPALATLAGADMALVVTEPTVAAIHDLERVLVVCRHFRVRTVVAINRCDLDEDNSRRIEEHCAASGAEVVARLPYDPAVVRAVVSAVTVVEHSTGEFARRIRRLWDRLSDLVREGSGEPARGPGASDENVVRRSRR